MADIRSVLAYRCPHCGSGIMSSSQLLNVPGQVYRVSCDCQKSTMSIEKERDDRFSLQVPCLLCGRSHELLVHKDLLFSEELVTLYCPYSELPICWAGEVNEVKAALAKSELELLNQMDELGVDQLGSFNLNRDDLEESFSNDNTSINEEDSLSKINQNRWYDPDLVEAVLYVIRELDEDGRIHCRCQADEEHAFAAEIREDGILVSCKKCGASRLIPTDPGPASEAFLQSDAIFLE